uniref:Uncharacterized protein n=1 Tax=Hyaloperonospora arabidopsidis (strain Emoy2) TaxID=559515 RepID=M4B8K1_HYAAE
MAPDALTQFMSLLKLRLAARVDQLRKRRVSLFGFPSQPATTSISGDHALRDSFLDNEAAMRSYADEVNLERVRNLSSEDRQALARKRSSTISCGNQDRHTMSNMSLHRSPLERRSL